MTPSEVRLARNGHVWHLPQQVPCLRKVGCESSNGAEGSWGARRGVKLLCAWHSCSVPALIVETKQTASSRAAGNSSHDWYSIQVTCLCFQARSRCGTERNSTADQTRSQRESAEPNRRLGTRIEGVIVQRGGTGAVQVRVLVGDGPLVMRGRHGPPSASSSPPALGASGLCSDVHVASRGAGQSEAVSPVCSEQSQLKAACGGHLRATRPAYRYFRVVQVLHSTALGRVSPRPCVPCFCFLDMELGCLLASVQIASRRYRTCTCTAPALRFPSGRFTLAGKTGKKRNRSPSASMLCSARAASRPAAGTNHPLDVLAGHNRACGMQKAPPVQMHHGERDPF